MKPTSILDARQPEWHTTLIETSGWLQRNMDGLFWAMQVTKHEPALQAYSTETIIALMDMLPLVTDMKNLWSNNFKANLSLKQKTHTVTDVATKLLEVVLMLHGLSTNDVYTNVYKLICPWISFKRLAKEDMNILTKIFGGFNGTRVKLEKLKHGFLEKHPEYAFGTKRKCDPKVLTEAVVIGELMDNLPAEYGENPELQEGMKRCFIEYTNGVQADFTAAGLGELDQSQIDSVMVGSMVNEYFGNGKFGEGV